MSDSKTNNQTEVATQDKGAKAGERKPRRVARKPRRPLVPREEIFVDYIKGKPAEIIDALSRKVGSKGYNARVRDLLVSAAIAMTWARDHSGAHVGPRVLASLLDIDTLHQIVNRQHKLFARVPEEVIAGIRHYLAGLTGYDPVQGANQSGVTVSNHTFQERKAVEVLRSGNGPRKPRDNRKGDAKRDGGKPRGKGKPAKDVKEAPAENTFEREAVVDKVNGFAIRKKSTVAGTKQVQVSFTVVISDDNLKNFNSLGEAREFAKEYKGETE